MLTVEAIIMVAKAAAGAIGAAKQLYDEVHPLLNEQDQAKLQAAMETMAAESDAMFASTSARLAAAADDQS